ncbi:unnamed protein product [Heligmosomoides polygyrus]|uniref:RNase H domain-containing protein n=1 Tax=Heligmosomoides polygyrus TaxID=6339 RepID=A0A183FFV8_HELPZ|nr:unnamed protein product [Heligmosomoides polygyrus]
MERHSDGNQRILEEAPDALLTKRIVKLSHYSLTRAPLVCAVIYLCHNQGGHLLMAMPRLPKLVEKTIVPKMEVNALKMAARLSKSTFDELKNSIVINSIRIFSDSQIALHWLKKAAPEKEVEHLVHNNLREIRATADDLREK